MCKPTVHFGRVEQRCGAGEAQSIRERERAIRQNRDLPGCRGGGALALTSTAC